MHISLFMHPRTTRYPSFGSARGLQRSTSSVTKNFNDQTHKLHHLPSHSSHAPRKVTIRSDPIHSIPSPPAERIERIITHRQPTQTPETTQCKKLERRLVGQVEHSSSSEHTHISTNPHRDSLLTTAEQCPWDDYPSGKNETTHSLNQAVELGMEGSESNAPQVLYIPAPLA
jgi:hypothetical protein